MTPRQRPTTRNHDQEDTEDADILSVLEFCSTINEWSNSQQARRFTYELTHVPASALALLRRLERNSPVTVSELATQLRLHPSTISTQLHPLVEQRLIRRTVDKNDRRVVSLSITRVGRNTCERVREHGAREWAIVLSSWSERDRHRLAELMDRARQDALSAIRVSLEAADVVDTAY